MFLISLRYASADPRSPDLFEAGWRVVAGAIESSITSTTEAIPALLPELLQQFVASFEKGTVPAHAANDLLLLVVRTTLAQCATLLQAEEDARVVSLVSVLERFGELVFADQQMAEVRDTHMSECNSLTFTFASERRRLGPVADHTPSRDDAFPPAALPQVPQG